jgi:DNA-3-methyladenine glycosylase
MQHFHELLLILPHILNKHELKLKKEFYLRENVVEIARDLLGKYLFTFFDEGLTGGIITETEAYNGIADKASHAYSGRRTARTEIMYAAGGTAYVYLCYGIHSLFNVVTNQKDIPNAVLIRAIKPVEGIPLMLKRRNKFSADKSLAAGPGTLSQALGIHYLHSGTSLSGKNIWIEDRKIIPAPGSILVTPRIGVDYAGEDAKLPYRFVWDADKKL